MLCDGGGLYLTVSAGPDGTVHKSWIFRFARVENGRQIERQMGLGPTHTVTLAEAREKALAARKLRFEGIDPIEHRRRQRAALAAEEVAKTKVVTFAKAADEYLRRFDREWKSARHAAEWRTTLQRFVLPQLGSKDIEAISTDDVLAVLLPIWSKIPESASRIRGRIEIVLDFAGRNGSNPARWKGHLEHRLPKRNRTRSVKSFAAMDWREMPGFMASLAHHADMPAQALRFLILTACRSGEVLGATWDEIDLEARTWTIPGSRMKRDREHRVPLSDDAVAIIERMAEIRHDDRIFPVGPAAMLRRLNEIFSGITVHGFRSSFCDWASETTGTSVRVIDAALAHAVSDKTEAAYRRGDLFERRRELMSAWAAYCAPPAGSNVVEMRSGLPAA
jgi:integrase